MRALNQALGILPGVQVSVVSLHDAFTEADLPAWQPLRPSAFSSLGPHSFGYSPGLRAAVLNSNADIVHIHGLWQYPSVVSLQWHRRTGRPYLISPHGMLDPWALNNSKWKKRLARWLFEDAHLRRAACIHALCESEARSIRALGFENPIAIIPNGVDLAEMRNAERGMRNAPWAHAIEPGRKVLLYLGRLHPKKGLVNLLHAWARANAECGMRNAEWVLAIAGWDQAGHEAQLKRLCEVLQIRWDDLRRQETSNSEQRTSNIQHPTPNIQHRTTDGASVFFLGPQFGAEKDACYRNCDAFILPSFSEGLPMAVLEAWAYGKPVLMTPQCNLPEGFAAGAALPVEANPDSVARGLEELFRLPESALYTMGENGRALVEARFSWPKIAHEMKVVYEWVLGRMVLPSCLRAD